MPGFTFNVSKTKPEKFEGVSRNPLERTSLVKEFHDFGQKVYRSSNRTVLEVPFRNGFVGTIFQAYCLHCDLSISPDHVWLAIVHAFNIYMNHMNKAEELREKFVHHQGKMKLEVIDFGTLASVDWSLLVKTMAGLIEKSTVAGVRDWLEPNFSTTSEEDVFVGRLMLMSAMQKYFSYKVTLLCGIPRVTLEGDPADWERLRERVDRLDEYGLGAWRRRLVPVLDEFVRAARGSPDVDFWTRVCHKEGGGSESTYLGGWINVFVPFIERDGRKGFEYVLPDALGDYGRVDTDDIPVGTCTVPFDLDDNGTEMELEFCSGFFGATLSGTTLRPSLDWSIRDRSKSIEPCQYTA